MSGDVRQLDLATRSTVKLLLAGLLLLGLGCGSDGSGGEEPSARSTTASTSTASTPAIVGRWKRVNKCGELVKSLNDAGLGAIAPAVVGDFFPDIPATQLARKDDICEGARPFVHYHFFNAAGGFGSLDQHQQQVDEGPYEIADDRTFVIPMEGTPVRFHYALEGDALTLSPVITPAMKRNALAHPLKFTPAGWGIAVSYPGHEWTRVDCGAWC